MLPIGIVFAIVLRMKTKANKLIVYFLFCCKTCICNKWLYKNRTYFAIFILGETNHVIWACVEIFIMSIDTLKKRGQVVIGITEIIELNDFLLVKRQIRFIL